jgi:hypothetical protein
MGGNMLAPGPDGSMPVRALSQPVIVGGAAATATSVSAAIIVPAKPGRQFLTLWNNNGTAANYVVCAFGVTATTTNGFQVPAGSYVSFPQSPGGPVPGDYVSCIAAASTPAVYFLQY